MTELLIKMKRVDILMIRMHIIVEVKEGVTAGGCLRLEMMVIR
jgi:hypothetical protein